MEAIGTLTGGDLARALGAYRHVLRLHQDAINRLNVYPVPDGDTGTNMALTVESVVAELAGVEGVGDLDESDFGPTATPGARRPEMAAVCKAIAHGSLMGARGNSGVILSQLLRGCTQVLAALDRGRTGRGGPGPRRGQRGGASGRVAAGGGDDPLRGARRGPRGGTGRRGRSDPDRGVLEAARREAAEALARTPEQLPVLAQAGVVDAGGSGYLLLLDALLTVVDGRPLPEAPAPGPDEVPVLAAVDGDAGDGEDREAAAEGGGGQHLRYEVMYMLEAPDATMPAFKEVWAGIGDSIVVVGGDALWNCHIHTNDVGASIEAALDAGRPRNIRVTDLVEQMEEERWVREAAALGPDTGDERAGPPPRTAVVAVANGEGVGRIFRSLGVHHLVAGGQSMNPVHGADPRRGRVGVLERGGPAAQQRQHPSGGDAGRATWPPRRCGSSPPAGSSKDSRRCSNTTRRRAPMTTPPPWRPRRAVSSPAKSPRPCATPPGRWDRSAPGTGSGLSRDGVEVVGETLGEAACGLLGKLLRDDHELVTLIEGDGSGPADTRQVTEWLAEHRADIAVEVHHGGQPLYPYLISIE